MPTTITLPSKYTEDENGNKFAPITTPNAVRFPDGTNLNDVLANLGTSDVMPIVIISTTPPTGSIGLIYFNPNTSKFYQYNRNDEYAEIETPHKAIGFSTASQQEHYFEIVDGVISQEAYDDWGGWYIDYTGAYLEIGQMMYFDNLATVYLPTRQQMMDWSVKYTMPSGGIPATDMASAVQTSLGKADTALQSQAQADWSESNTNAPAYIKNKPTIPTFSSLTLNGTAQAYDGTHTLKVQDGTSSQKGIVQLGTSSSNAAAGNHTHGYINSNGTLASNSAAIANGDAIVIYDASNSGKITRASIAFDGSTATQALTKKGTFETFITSQDISGKEDKMVITAQSSSASLTATLNTYYRITTYASTLAVTLPTVSDSTKVQTVVIFVKFSSTPNLTISATGTTNVYFHETYSIEANSSYEINCLYNGSAWIVSSTKIIY